MGILYQFISAAFCVIVLLSNIIGVKLVPLPLLDLAIPAGVFIYPLTFLLSDLVTEIFGTKRARQMVYIALAMNVLSFIILQCALCFPSHDFEHGKAFQLILGLSGLRILSSLIAYIIAQIVDIQLYAFIRRWTGGKFLWMRNNGSTWVAQAVDTVVVDVIYLCGGLGMGLTAVFPIMGFSYVYKAFFSIATTPFLYLLVFLIKKGTAERASLKI